MEGIDTKRLIGVAVGLGTLVVLLAAGSVQAQILGGYDRHDITTSAEGAEDVVAADLDGDGIVDVVAASAEDDTVAWYENDGSQNFTEHVITESAESVQDVVAEDLDDDGDLDVLSASYHDGTVAWYENDGSGGFTTHLITTDSDGASDVDTGDVDGDGDIDVLVASTKGPGITWWENHGSGLFTEHVISYSSGWIRDVEAVDLDDDGHMDVLSTRGWKIYWHENDGSESFTTHTLSTTADGVEDVDVADINGDGALDVVAAEALNDEVHWYENDIGDSDPYLIQGGGTVAEAEDVQDVDLVDVDGDGDVDVLSASEGDDTVAWHENEGQHPIYENRHAGFTTHTISTSVDQARSVFAADVDGDGETDALSTSRGNDTVSWHEKRTLEDSIPDILGSGDDVGPSAPTLGSGSWLESLARSR